ncbi:MAG TPA: DUF2975 domain-containing protein [Gemmatimonadaceae bacterium]|nr:DUF2975 domain-containing protein [Gemmatimonadaceae bacterium]
MTSQYPAVLTGAERVLKGLTVLNVLYGTGILLLLLASLAAPGPLFNALVGKPADVASAAIRGMRLMMIVGIAAVPVAHVIFARLRAMLLTVRAGDPFVVENARRLNAIAIAVLALELLHLVVGAVAKSDAFAALGIHIDWSFSFTPWVAVMLLFVLARVFEHGARMRADLEGTV